MTERKTEAKSLLCRRIVLRASGWLGVVALLDAAACGKEKTRRLVCTDTTGLSSIDAQVRATLAYVDVSTEPGKTCVQCQQFLPPPTEGACGACKVVKGPINPKGNCKSFLAKVAG
jgi:hypothetical protein